MINIFEPYLNKREIQKNINYCVEKNWISSQGKFVKEFEKSLAKYHDVKYCVSTSSCTTALHLSIKALDLKKDDEIICPSLTFIAPANMIILSGAKLVLVDIDRDTLTLDPNKIEKKITKKTKAILVVHQFGHAAHMDEIRKISKKYKLKIIEDNAESLGGSYKKKKLDITETEIINKINLRNKARLNKDYKEADNIRNYLLDKGVLIEDKDGKTIWKLK